MATARHAPHAARIVDTADALAPLLAGARARGMFDALEMMGQAAVLLDAAGEALAVTSAAPGAFGLELALEGRQLISADADDDSRLRAAIRDALDGYESRVSIGTGARELTLRLTPVSPIPGQLLTAILLIFPHGTPLGGALAAPDALHRRHAAAH